MSSAKVFKKMGFIFFALLAASFQTAIGAQEKASKSSKSLEIFVHKREDAVVPAKCRPLKLDYFAKFPLDEESLKQKLILVSLIGAHKAGFSHEYPMQRPNADILWTFFKTFVTDNKGILDTLKKETSEELRAKANADLKDKFTKYKGDFDSQTRPPETKAALLRDIDLIWEHMVEMDMRFNNNGEVLEALWPEAVKPIQNDEKAVRVRDEYPADKHFYTGGIEYRRLEENARTVGELDIVIGKKDTCEIVAIGEAKLGVRQISHARSQLKRFIGFLKEKLPVQKAEKEP